MPTRKQQIKELQARLWPVAGDLEALIEELQAAFDNTPESIQAGDRGEAMQERIDMLQEWHDQLTEMAEAEI